MKKKYYFITGILSYLVFLLATFPAKPVTDLINENTTLSLSGVSGNVWQGNALSISINNSTHFENTGWSFNLWKLLIGQLAIELESEFLENELTTETGVSLTGQLFVNNLITAIPAPQLAELINIPLVQLDGMISLNIETARWKPGELPVASGQLNWSNATITVAETVSLGDVSIALFESEQGLLTGNISNKGGDIKISGSAELIAEANYSIDIKLEPLASASNNIKQSLGMIAKRQPAGDYLLKNTGALTQIGLM